MTKLKRYVEKYGFNMLKFGKISKIAAFNYYYCISLDVLWVCQQYLSE